MKLVVQVKLMPEADQAAALRSTLCTVNEAACWVSGVAFERGIPREYELRKLGLVDVSDPALEDVDEIVSRVDTAAECIDIDDLALSTNGPFTAAGTLTIPQQRAKLELVETAARYFWGNEL